MSKSRIITRRCVNVISTVVSAQLTASLFSKLRHYAFIHAVCAPMHRRHILSGHTPAARPVIVVLRMSSRHIIMRLTLHISCDLLYNIRTTSRTTRPNQIEGLQHIEVVEFEPKIDSVLCPTFKVIHPWHRHGLSSAVYLYCCIPVLLAGGRATCVHTIIAVCQLCLQLDKRQTTNNAYITTRQILPATCQNVNLSTFTISVAITSTSR